ncbi:10702_t:CDS:2 [Ambispora leptoticha]|uniref:10702_t:CDS:1 n=1 Tax=Ambispora leptoticha TaxID=144679 RepID=A0A9N9AKK0_9GLOM|nr:10702_t:CDS:2 [Ambispora leptoticha]
MTAWKENLTKSNITTQNRSLTGRAWLNISVDLRVPDNLSILLDKGSYKDCWMNE